MKRFKPTKYPVRNLWRTLVDFAEWAQFWWKFERHRIPQSDGTSIGRAFYHACKASRRLERAADAAVEVLDEPRDYHMRLHKLNCDLGDIIREIENNHETHQIPTPTGFS